MRTVIAATAQLDLEFPRYYKRYLKWLDYLEAGPYRDDVGEVVLIENGSSRHLRSSFEEASTWATQVIRCPLQYMRNTPKGLGYPYAWRYMKFAEFLHDVMEYDKVILWEPDFRIRTERMWNDVVAITEGFHTPFSEIYQFPETSFMVSCAGNPVLKEINSVPWKERGEVLFEGVVRTAGASIHTEWMGDRYSERGLQCHPDADYEAQVLD